MKNKYGNKHSESESNIIEDITETFSLKKMQKYRVRSMTPGNPDEFSVRAITIC